MKINYKHEIKPSEKLNEEDLIEILLRNRQIKDKKEFLHPTHPAKIKLLDFGFKRELKKTLKLLEKIKKNNQMIVVYTDYDADGITGGAILWETLHLLGFKVMPYVPHRKLEGYGFSFKGLDNVKKQFAPALIISVDHGITAKEKVAYAKKLGIPVIITDHHLKPEKLPKAAEAIFHIPLLSGSGVAYFFAKEIYSYYQHLQSGRTSAVEESDVTSDGRTAEVKTDWQKLEENFSSDYLSLASIGSIADLVPLVGPTRSLVKHGLEAFPTVKRTGIKHILQQAGILGRKITPYEVGFIIAPRINAAGRLEHAIDALRLLCTTKEDRARNLAGKVGDKNRERQDLLIKAVEEAKQLVSHKYSDVSKMPKIIILENKRWHEGIIGLIASKIAEEFYRPTIVLTESDGFLKGSARSIPTFHITNFLRDLKKYLIDVGGHKGAAGFTMEKNKFNIFETTAYKMVKKSLDEKDLERTLEADIKIPLSKLNMKLVKALEILQPFGIGNPQPTFYSEVEVLHHNTFGKNDDHLKLIVRDIPTKKLASNFQLPIEFVSFGTANKFTTLAKGQKIKTVYSLEIDRWGGSEKLRGKIINLA